MDTVNQTNHMEDRDSEILQRSSHFLKAVYDKYLLASILSMLSASAAGMIDTILAGRFLGEKALSAMSLVSPLYLLYYCFGAILGVGGSISANLHIGKNEYDEYRCDFTLSFLITALFSLLITIFGLVFLNPLSTLLGAQGELRIYVIRYLRIYIAGGVFTLFIYIPLNFLKVQGKPQTSSLLFLLSAVLNISFSWLFMSPICRMGIAGAALGTVLSMAITTLSGLWILLKRTEDTRFVRLSGFQGIRLKQILLLGSPNGANNLLNALKISLLNELILPMGSGFLSSFVIMKSVSDLLTGVVAGQASALIPLCGVYYGEQDWGSIRRVLKLALRSGFFLTLSACTLTILGRNWIPHLAGLTGVSALEAGHALLYLAISFLFAFFSMMFSGYCNAIDKPLISNLTLSLRLLGFPLLLAPLCGKCLGVRGIWLSVVLSEALCLLTTLLIMKWIRMKHPGLDKYLIGTEDPGQEEISFSVPNSMDDVMTASERIMDFAQGAGLSRNKAMRISLALEEMLTVIILYCMPRDGEGYIDIRIIVQKSQNVLLRLRSTGKIFNPVDFYEQNKDSKDMEMQDRLLGIRMINGMAKEVTFRETFGVNNLIIRF